MKYDRSGDRAPEQGATTAAVPKTVAAITHIQRLAGNAAVSRAFQPDPGQIAQLQGGDNHFGQKISISPDLLEMLSETSAPPNRDLVPAASGATFEQYDGHAFVRGAGDTNAVDPNDVKQGLLGDCYLCAAMIAVARANPARIRSLISKQANGTYNVTLHLKAGVWSREGGAQVVNVTPRFPTTGDDPAYVKEGDVAADGGPELWAMLIEKAYAQVKGGYLNIAAGNSGEAAAMLTGGRSTEYQVASMTSAQIASLIDEALTNRWPVTCNTPGAAKDESGEKSADREGFGIISHHSYAPRSVNVSAGTVELQNPWGYQDITLQISGPFKRYFKSVDVVRP